ncbi:MAG: Preprotein translocase subunit SecD [Parcubacteria group bacterium GW2011_GWC1_41_7]|nr:MAG: Preprotein translocase subunit SecD [Parcubacteria group bacterium GW2011_GWC1_41_7]
MVKKDKIWLFTLLVIGIAAAGIAFYPKFPYKLGLDVSGGTVLTYQADLSKILKQEKTNTLEGVKDLIERRINVLGVSEVNVSYTDSGRVVIEIPNIKDPEEAKRIIGETPMLEFRIPVATTAAISVASTTATTGTIVATSQDGVEFVPTDLTGRYLQSAQVQFNQNTIEPIVSLQFDKEGGALFKQLTEKYLGQPIAIYLDGGIISAPTVQDVITDGKAQITGRFTVQEAQLLAQRLNQGALPVPLTSVSETVINPVLGDQFLAVAIKGGLYGALLVALFMLLYYRGLGVIANIALLFYVVLNLALFKILGVVLSLSAIAGLILSVGIAVDANILVFERTREELKRTASVKGGNERRGARVSDAVDIGFARAWTSIRDSNVSSMLSSAIIYLSTTSFVKGFALTFGVGVLTSMLTAYFLSRILIKQVEHIFHSWPRFM